MSELLKSSESSYAIRAYTTQKKSSREGMLNFFRVWSLESMWTFKAKHGSNRPDTSDHRYIDQRKQKVEVALTLDWESVPDMPNTSEAGLSTYLMALCSYLSRFRSLVRMDS